MSANVVLHWMLDSINLDNTVGDQSDNHLNGTIEGDPKVVADPMFGSCIEFDGVGDAITLSDTPGLRLNAYTVEVWIKASAVSGWVGIVGKPGRDYNMWVHPTRYVHHRFSTPSNVNTGAADTPAGSFEWDTWTHLAITNDGSTARTYINGELIVETAYTEALQAHETKLIVGRSLDDAAQSFFVGRLAHLRIYDGALSAAEITSDMSDDESAAAAFLKSHPLEFHLYNEDEQEVLYIDDSPTGQTMRLDIVNTSRKAIDLAQIGTEANANSYHFALNFRSGTLDTGSLSRLTLQPQDWLFGVSSDGTALYFSKNSSTLNPGERVSLSINGLNADGARGTHGTRVELAYQNMRYQEDPVDLVGTRLQHLNIVNHRGLRRIPLHVSLIKGDRVLSDGTTPNELWIRIANISQSDLALSPSGSLAPSRFVISFDAQQQGQEREWALTDTTNSRGVIAAFEKVENSTAVWSQPQSLEGDESQTIGWEIIPGANKVTDSIALGSNGSLTIWLSKIIALKSLGHANIYVDYQNIPGYQDGTFVLAVEKTPLVFYQKDTNTTANTGIGINNPASALDVNGNIFSRGHDFVLGRFTTVRGDSGYSRALVKWQDATLVINFEQDFKGGVRIKGPKIQLDSATYINAAQSNANGGALFIQNLRFGQDTSNPWIQSHSSQPLAINPIGNNVGIGTDKPGEKLHVNGTIYTGGLRVNSSYSIQKMLAGHAQLGSHKGGVKKITITFPEAFTRKPYVIASVRSEGYYDDTYACTVRYIDTRKFEINILRVEKQGNGWGQNLRLDWMAWETTRDSDA